MENKAHKSILLLLLCGAVCSCASQKYYSDGVIDHSLCVNSHLGYSGYDFEYRGEVSAVLGDINAGMIRDYVFINSADIFLDSLSHSIMDPRANRLYVVDNVLFHLQKKAPNTQVLGVLHDMKWEIDKDVPFSRFYDIIGKAVKRYDGHTRFVPADSRKEMSFEIKYWEICNEMDLHIYENPPFSSIEKTFELLKNSYRAIKAANPEAVVVFPGIANAKSRFLQDIMDYEDVDGKRIWDYYDIFNFHVYPKTAVDLIDYINQVKNCQKKYGWNKPIWLTEIGWSELQNSESEVAAQLPKMYLIALACGIDKVFQFQLRSFDHSLGNSASFGLIRSSLDGSYMSLMSGEKPLSLGTAYQHILVRDSIYSLSPSDYSHRKVGNSIYQKLKQSGLSISGNDFVINRISVIGNNREHVFLNKEERGVINLPPYVFANMDYLDRLAISFKDFKKIVHWKKTDKTLSYYAVKNLIELLPDGSTKPTLEKQNGIYLAKWQVGKKLMTALWSERKLTVSLYGKGKMKALNYLGKKVKIDPLNVILSNNVLYLDGDINYSIQ